MSSQIYPFSTLTLITLLSYPVLANQHVIPTQSDFGGIGLMQMPSGRTAEEGEFSLGTTINQDYYHYFASLQLMPWLESTVRYTRVPSRLYSGDENFSGDTIYTDKGIDVKLRLLEETYWLPETSIGIRDLGGTGLFDGEFIAMNKRVGSVDFTLGVGWGYIGNRANLLGNKQTSNDCDRNTSYSGRGGSFDFSRWFTGCASVFGGVEYQSPWAPLSFKLEYDGNDYVSDFASGLVQDSPWNVGAVYRFDNWADIRLSFERGNTWTLGATFKTNFSTLKQPWFDEPKAPLDIKNTKPDWHSISEQLEKNAGYRKNKIYVSDDQITVIGEQTKYRNKSYAHERAAAILLNTGVKASRFSLIEEKNNQLITQTDIDTHTYRKIANQGYVDAKITDATTTVSPSSPRGILQIDSSTPWSIGLSPSLQQSIGGSEGFYMFNIGVSGNASYWFNNNINIGGSAYLNIYDTYDKFLYTVPPDGTNLLRVRTLIRQYITNNRFRVSNLQLTGFSQPTENIYTQAYLGYLETMFAGGGGEVLYRPLHSNWALGLDLNYVIQRDPDTQFGLFTQERLFDKETGRFYRVQTGAMTGHASIYYRPNWSFINDLTLKFSAGRYLAEDLGFTLDASKQFDSGVIAGAFIAKTNLSSEEFGEGSFNKGFYISIPFDIFTIKPSVNRAHIGWTPLSRDGGQMLNRKYNLFNMTEARDPKSEQTNR